MAELLMDESGGHGMASAMLVVDCFKDDDKEEMEDVCEDVPRGSACCLDSSDTMVVVVMSRRVVTVVISVESGSLELAGPTPGGGLAASF